jgi:hypothetical protein
LLVAAIHFLRWGPKEAEIREDLLPPAGPEANHGD